MYTSSFSSTNQYAPLSQGQSPVIALNKTFQALSTDDKLGLLWIVYTNMGGSITPAAPGAARTQFIEGLLEQVKGLTFDEQYRFMCDLVERRNSDMTRAYGVFSNNNKLAFWYKLAVLMDAGEVVPVPSGYKLSRDANIVFNQIAGLEFNQQITFLRQSVIDMGFDPFA